MAKVKKLKISTPQTADGRNLIYNADKQPVYSTSIVELSSKKDFEALNAKIPSEALKHKIEEVEVEEETSVPVSKSSVSADDQKAIAEAAKKEEENQKAIAEKDKAIADKDKELEELKKQLAAATKKQA